MKTQVIVLLTVLAAGWAFAGVNSQAVKHPDARDGDEAWGRYSAERGLRYSGDDLVAIWKYLESVDAGSAETASIKNNLLDRLVEQEPIPSGLGAKLLRLYQERSVNVRMRDYTLQHFAPYIMNVARYGNWKKDDDAQSMIAELLGALWNGEGAMGGTALLALESVASLGDPVSISDVATYAVNLAVDEKRPAAVRVTAIQTATRLGSKEVLGSARVAIRADQPLSLRLAATACLGTLGGPSDVELLKHIKDEDSSSHLRLAAGSALGRRSRVETESKTVSPDASEIRKGNKI